MYRNFFVLGGLGISAIHTVGLAGLKSRIFYLVQLVAVIVTASQIPMLEPFLCWWWFD